MTDIPSQATPFNTPPVTTSGGDHKVTVLIGQAHQVVRLARALAESGRTVDLVGLDHLVGVLCAQALDLPPPEGRMFRASLEVLLAECDALGSTLRNPTPPRQKAASCPSHRPPS